MRINPALDRRSSLRDIDIAAETVRHAFALVRADDDIDVANIFLAALRALNTERAMLAASGSVRLQELRTARASLRRAYLHVSLDTYASYVVRNALNELQAEMDETR